MDLGSLEIFRSVVEEGSITRAALRLHRVQSNVTTRVRQLEESLGTPLFLRDRKRMVLTPAGQILLDYTYRLLQLSNQARQAVQANTPCGRLRIGSMESTAATRLPSILSRYRQRWPQVGLELRTMPTAQALQALSRFELDCAFVAGSADDTMLACESAFEERLVLITSTGHSPVRSAGDLPQSTLLSFGAGCAYRTFSESWFAAAGIHPNIIEIGSYHALIACVSAGIGVALIPHSLLELYRELPNIDVHFPENTNITTWLVWHTALPSPALTALRAEIGKSGPSGSERTPPARDEVIAL